MFSHKFGKLFSLNPRVTRIFVTLPQQRHWNAIPWQVWRDRWRDWIRRSHYAHDALPLMLSVIVGLVTALATYSFVVLLRTVGDLADRIRDDYGVWAGLGLMIVAGLVVGLIVNKFARETKGPGVPDVMEAVALRRGRIRPRVAVIKIIASSITIGSGGSAGREGPIVQVGSAIGSATGQWTRLSDEQVSMLVASGAAAGIAAAFNAPIAGTLFALEVILGRFTNRYLGIVVISAVSASVVSRILLGENPAFIVPAYRLNSPLELFLYIVLGVLCALSAILFIRTLYAAEHIFHKWDIPLVAKTMLGMALTGIIALWTPEVRGSGLEFIGEAIANDIHFSVRAMIVLWGMKILATSLTLGSGNSGGELAPSLFIGAMVGGIMGRIGEAIWPNVVVNPGAFALVGMSALFAGSARAPITAIMIVLEMSNDYHLILPLLLTVIISTLIADFLQPESMYTLKLALRGIRLERGQDVDMLQSVRVNEVMSRDYPVISPTTLVRDLIPRFNLTHSHGFAMIDEHGHLAGVITLSDIERVIDNPGTENMTALAIGTSKNLVVVYPDDPVYAALRRLNIYHIGRLPVVDRKDGKTYLGMVRRADILQAYEIGLARKSIEQHKQHHFKLRDVEENEFIEVRVEKGAPMVGVMLRQFPYVDACLIISIRRDGQTLIPHGDTVIQAGDIVTAYVYPKAQVDVASQFAPNLTKTP